MKTEKHLQNYLFALAKLNGIYCRKVAAIGRVGFPDVLLAARGAVVLIELKSPAGTGVLSKMQLLEHRLLRAAGLQVYVVDTKEGVEHAIGPLIN